MSALCFVAGLVVGFVAYRPLFAFGARGLARCHVSDCRRVVWPPWGRNHLCAHHEQLWQERTKEMK